MQIKASNLDKMIPQARKTGKISVFLGGDCHDNDWREALEKEFPDILFLDPYDEDWRPEKNIYGELIGMSVADYVVFYKGGSGSKMEKKFLDSTGGSYKEFDDLKKLGKYIDGLSKPKQSPAGQLRKVARLLLLEE
jgi:hypothetical protein